MKKMIIRILLILGYCVPFVFLAMNGDVTAGSMWFYLIAIVGFWVLCAVSIKTQNRRIVVIGNILSFVSSCIFAWCFKTEKWEYFFKPFLPNQLIIFETVVVSAVQMIFIIYFTKKNKLQGE